MAAHRSPHHDCELAVRRGPGAGSDSGRGGAAQVHGGRLPGRDDGRNVGGAVPTGTAPPVVVGACGLTDCAGWGRVGFPAQPSL